MKKLILIGLIIVALISVIAMLTLKEGVFITTKAVVDETFTLPFEGKSTKSWTLRNLAGGVIYVEVIKGGPVWVYVYKIPKEVGSSTGVVTVNPITSELVKTKSFEFKIPDNDTYDLQVSFTKMFIYTCEVHVRVTKG